MEVYNGNDVFEPFNAGLYGMEGDTDRSFQLEESKESVLHAFKNEYEDAIKEALEGAGLKYGGLEYYSPRFYNFSTDSIDLKLELEDREKYEEAVESHHEKIQGFLDANKSYDGYMALTSDTFEEARDNLEVPCIRAILSGIDFSEFDINEFLEWAYPCEQCELVHEDRMYLSKEEEQKVEKCEGNT